MSTNSYNYDVYKDIQIRTNGEIYIGVVGPVRTGKSTFIKQFMDLLVIPNIKDIHSKERAIDELPQSANGKIIMTTEPKFIPKEAVEISLESRNLYDTNSNESSINNKTDITMKVRLIDCVGYMVDGALGHEENDKERMVKTPWFDYDIPFVKAAEIGTRKVITDHSTIGIMVTTDGSFGEIPRESYIEAEEKTAEELKKIGKPYIIILNTNKPYSIETINLVNELENKYNTKVIPLNCANLKKEDIENILIDILSVFPIELIEFDLPPWIETLGKESSIKKYLIDKSFSIFNEINNINDAKKINLKSLYNNDENTDNYLEQIVLDGIDMQQGIVRIKYDIYEKYYYDMLSKLTGVNIENEQELINTLKSLAEKKNEFDKVNNAYDEVRNNGYGVVTPDISEITIGEPELIKHGNKFGIKIKAMAPSTHMLKANITTEIAPIVGSEEQAKDLITYLQNNATENPDGIWETNIFGKSIGQLIDEGIQTKVSKMTDETREKMQETLQKLLNDSKGGVICIII